MGVDSVENDAVASCLHDFLKAIVKKERIKTKWGRIPFIPSMKTSIAAQFDTELKKTSELPEFVEHKLSIVKRYQQWYQTLLKTPSVGPKFTVLELTFDTGKGSGREKLESTSNGSESNHNQIKHTCGIFQTNAENAIRELKEFMKDQFHENTVASGGSKTKWARKYRRRKKKKVRLYMCMCICVYVCCVCVCIYLYLYLSI